MHNKKILVVDDDLQVLETYNNILVDSGDASADELMRMLVDDFDFETEESQQAIEIGGDQFQLVQATSGDEALILFKQAHDRGEPFAAVFIDIVMPPGMDGIECSSRIREIDPHVYLAVVSAYSEYTMDEMSTHLGQDFLFLRKPFTREELQQIARVFTFYFNRDRLQRERITRLEVELDRLRAKPSDG